MTSYHTKQPIGIKIASVLSAVIGIGCIYGGTVLITDPLGSTLGLSTDLISNLAIADYSLIGVFLLLIGLVLTSSSVGLWRNYSWGWALALMTNVVMIAWIILGVSLTGLHFTHQPIVLILCLWEIYLLFRPSVLRYTLAL
jgi:hypothetical protein